MRRIGPRVWPIGVAFGRPKISVWGHAGARSRTPRVACFPFVTHRARPCSHCLFAGLHFNLYVPLPASTLSAFSYHMCNMYQFVFQIPPVYSVFIFKRHVDHPRADFRREKPYHTHACTDKMGCGNYPGPPRTCDLNELIGADEPTPHRSTSHSTHGFRSICDVPRSAHTIITLTSCVIWSHTAMQCSAHQSATTRAPAPVGGATRLLPQPAGFRI